jgi:dienelactone hydrolase
MAARSVSQQERRRDALLALQWLAKRGDVDRARIGLLGWSHGGSAVLAATNLRHPAVAAAPVRASLAVAFYPGCSAELARGYQPAAPLLMLLGADDDWTPPAPCEKLAATATATATATVDAAVLAPRVQTYAGAVHGFDGTAPVRVRHDVPNGAHPGRGVMVGAQPAAREAARAELDAFLATHWGVQPPAEAASPTTRTTRTTRTTPSTAP